MFQWFNLIKTWGKSDFDCIQNVGKFTFWYILAQNEFKLI